MLDFVHALRSATVSGVLLVGIAGAQPALAGGEGCGGPDCIRPYCDSSGEHCYTLRAIGDRYGGGYYGDRGAYDPYGGDSGYGNYGGPERGYFGGDRYYGGRYRGYSDGYGPDWDAYYRRYGDPGYYERRTHYVCDPEGDRCYRSEREYWDFREYYRRHGYRWQD